MKRVLKEDTSSLDVEHIDTDKIERYRKIRVDPFVKRLAIVSSSKTKKVLQSLQDKNRRNSCNNSTNMELNNSLHKFSSPSFF